MESYDCVVPLAVAATCALLAACEPDLPPVQAGPPIPPGPTPGEVAELATAQMRYRQGLATGDGNAVATANETFRQIPREIFSRQNPTLFDAKLVCERNQVAGPTATVVASPFGPQCRNIEWRYKDAAIGGERMCALVPAFGGLDVNLRGPALQHERPRQARNVGPKRCAGQPLAICAMADPDGGRIDLGLVRDLPTVAAAGHFHRLLRSPAASGG
jgi:hypothetical protein